MTNPFVKKNIPNALTWILSAGCLALAVTSVVFDQINRALQHDLQQQVAGVREEMQRVSGVENLSQNILTDLGNVAVSNVEIRVLLARHGYSLADTNGTSAAITSVPKLSASELEQGLSLVKMSPKTGTEVPVQEQKP